MTGPGLREQKKEATERALAQAACDLVLARGLAAVTVDDIVGAVGVSRRTFSNYFANKEEALAAVLVHRVSDGLASWAPPPGTQVVDLLRDLVGHQLRSGSLEPLTRLAPLAREHPGFLPHFREAQWTVWRRAGQRVSVAAGADDRATAVQVAAVMGAVFGVVSTAVGEGFSVDEADGLSPAAVGESLLAALDLLERGVG